MFPSYLFEIVDKQEGTKETNNNDEIIKQLCHSLGISNVAITKGQNEIT